MKCSAVWLCSLSIAATGAFAQPATHPAASQPTTAASDDGAKVVALFGDVPITQGEVDRRVRVAPGITTQPFSTSKDPALRRMWQDQLQSIVALHVYEAYAKDHPGLVSDEEVNEAVDRFKQANRFTDDEAFEKFLQEKARMSIADLRRAKLADVLKAKLREQAANEQRITEFYATHGDGFDGTTVVVKHILIAVNPVLGQPADDKAALARIQEIREEIASGQKTFDDAGREYSDDVRNAGRALPPFQRFGKMLEPFAAAAFALTKEGEISEPVRTVYGYHLIQLVSRQRGDPVPFEQAKATIQDQLLTEAHIGLLMEVKAKHPVKLFVDYVKPPRAPIPPPAVTQPTTRPDGVRPPTTGTRPVIRRPTPPRLRDRPSPTPAAPPEGTPTAPP